MTPERVAEIYAQIGELVVVLDRDPVSRGPKYLQDLISKTRGYLNTTSFYLQECLREKHHEEMVLDALETDYQVQADELLATDPAIKVLPAIEDRLATVAVTLSDDRKKIQAAKREIKNLTHMEKAIRLRHKELESTMSAIRLQRGLIESELGTGSFYGDENEAIRGWGKGGKGPRPAELDDVEDLVDLWEAVEKKTQVDEPPAAHLLPAHEGPAETPEQSTPPQVVVEADVDYNQRGGSSDDPAISRFLKGDADLDDLLSSL